MERFVVEKAFVSDLNCVPGLTDVGSKFIDLIDDCLEFCSHGLGYSDSLGCRQDYF